MAEDRTANPQPDGPAGPMPVFRINRTAGKRRDEQRQFPEQTNA